MFNIDIEGKYFIDGLSGVQPKFLYNNYYYKVDDFGKESITEELVTKVLLFSNLNIEDFVQYEQGIINGKTGCRSLNFLQSNEDFVSFNEMHTRITNERLDWHLRRSNMQEKIEYTTEFIKKHTGVNIEDYLRKNITLDYIVRNVDRHFSNFGLIFNDDGTIKTAPIFDNGASLMSEMSIMYDRSLEDNITELKAKPFCDNIEEMYKYFGCGFKVDFKSLLVFLENNYKIKKGQPGYEQLIILKHQANKFLESEINYDSDKEILNERNDKITTAKTEGFSR